MAQTQNPYAGLVTGQYGSDWTNAYRMDPLVNLVGAMFDGGRMPQPVPVYNPRQPMPASTQMGPNIDPNLLRQRMEQSAFERRQQLPQMAAKDAPPSAAPGGFAQGGGTPTPGVQYGRFKIPELDLTEYKELLGQANQQFDQQAQAGQQQQEGLRQRLMAELNRAPNLDLTPLAALTDQWSGSRLAQSYQPGYTAGTQNNQVNTVSAQMMNAQNSAMENQAQALRSRLNNAFQMANMQHSAAKDQAQLDLEAQKIAIEKSRTNALGSSESHRIFQEQKDFKNFPEVKGIRAAADYLPKLKLFRDSVNKYGINSRQAENAFADMAVNYNKEIAGLGALAGADLALIEQAHSYYTLKGSLPSDLGSMMRNVYMGGKESVLAGIDQRYKQVSDAARKTDQELRSSPWMQSKHLSEVYEPIYNKFDAEDKGFFPQQKETASLPKVGDVVDGYTYKGGDPSLESSWSK